MCVVDSTSAELSRRRAGILSDPATALYRRCGFRPALVEATACALHSIYVGAPQHASDAHPGFPAAQAHALGDLRRRAERPPRRSRRCARAGWGRLAMNERHRVTTMSREPELLGQTVVVIGGSSGIGLETARRARAEGADVVLT